MKNKYDAIIIGGGTAGSVAAAYLAKSGLDVALFEKNPQIGDGRYVMNEIYNCPARPFIPTMNRWYYKNKGWWFTCADELDIDLHYVFIPNSAITNKKNSFPLLAPFCTCGEAFASYLKDEYGDNISDEACKDAEKIFDEFLNHPRSYWMEPERYTETAYDYITSITDNGEIRDIFQKLPGEFGMKNICLKEMSLSVFATTVLGKFACSWTPIMTLNDIPTLIVDEFGKAAERYGAEIFLNTKVNKVNISDNRAKSIEVNGTTVEADRIIIATNWIDYNELLGENLPAYAKETIIKYATASQEVYALQVGINSYDVIPQPCWSNLCFMSEDHELKLNMANPSWYCDPQCGVDNLIITAEVSVPLNTIRDTEQLKEEILQTIEDKYPGFKGSIECISDTKYYPSQDWELVAAKRIPNVSDIKGLYFCGGAAEGPAVIGLDRSAGSARDLCAKIFAE